MGRRPSNYGRHPARPPQKGSFRGHTSRKSIQGAEAGSTANYLGHYRVEKRQSQSRSQSPATRAQIFKLDAVKALYHKGEVESRLRPSDKIHPKNAYQPGVVFSAPQHEYCRERIIQAGDANRTATAYGSVYSKYRKFVVISCNGNHCDILPIYSHQGNGLARQRYLDEWVAIRDAADEDPEPAETRHGTVFASRDASFRMGGFINGKSSIHLTAASSHRYDNEATIEGVMLQEDMMRLVLLVTNAARQKLERFCAANSPPKIAAADVEKEEGEVTDDWEEDYS